MGPRKRTGSERVSAVTPKKMSKGQVEKPERQGSTITINQTQIPGPLLRRSARSVYESNRVAQAVAVPKVNQSSKTTKRSRAKSAPNLKLVARTSESESGTKEKLNVADGDPTETSVYEDGSVPNTDEPSAESQTNDDQLVEEPHPIYCTLTQLEDIVLDDRSALVFMPLHTSLYFKGRFNLTVLSGTAEILGYLLKEKPEETYSVYSPRGYSLLCIRSCQLAESSTALNPKMLKVLGKWPQLNLQLVKEKLGYNIMLLVQRLEDSVSSCASQCWTVNLLRREPCVPQNMERREQESLQKLCDTLDCSFILRGMSFKARYYQQPNYWFSYTQNLLAQMKQNRDVRLAICGGKGVGKSTFLRYIINRLLSQHEAILVLDLDPGQAEFTPPGCVSLVLVKRPLLGPNFTHFQDPVRLHFVGDIDITACLDRYLDCCAKLIENTVLASDTSNCPLIINTMGFSTGLGLDLILDLVRLVQPTHLVQLMSRSSKRNFSALLEPDFIRHSPRGWKTHPDPQECPLSYEFTTFPSSAEQGDSCKEEWGLRSSELRDVALSSYLFKNLPFDLERNLTLLSTFKISLSSLYLCSGLEFSSPSLTLASLNGSIVALCSIQEDEAALVDQYSSEEPGHPTILGQLPVVSCCGYGIVRAMDLEASLVFISTPESPEKLASVNCLAGGGIHLPQKLVLQGLPQSTERGVHVPYVARGASSFQPSCQPYRRHNPPRNIS